MRQVFPQHERRNLVKLAEQSLWSSDGKEILTYLRETRRIKDSEIKSMHFGYVPKRFEGHELTGRLVMPLYDPYGSLVAITSRDISPTADQKHWHESFEKRNQLYGVDIAKRSIIEKKKAIVVEGQFDVAYLRSLGFYFTVGMLGSAMSLLQTSILARYCSEIYLFFDGDTSGREAAQRSMKMYEQHCLKSFDLMFYVVNTPDNKDPDDFTRDEVISLCKQAKDKVNA